MKRSRLEMIGGFFLAALLSSPAWGSVPPQPGTVNYIEGQASIGSRALTETSIGTARLTAGQSLSTENGRAEILLTPGVFLRINGHSTLQMNSAGLADTVTTLAKGRAMVEVDEIRPANNIRVAQANASVRLLKAGLYDFDADHGIIRVFDGEAAIQIAGREIQVKSGHELDLNAQKLKARGFDKKAQTSDDFYRWASLRSSYLAEANVDEARTHAGANGVYAGGWYGDGWYWNPWFSAYTFIPGDGIFYDPFGWGFYSPWLAFGAPYYGFGYGYFGGRYFGGGYAHHFGPGYRPMFNPGAHSAGMFGHTAEGHAYHVGGNTGAFSRAGGFHSAGGGFHGGGFGGGGLGGGGFHGGGGGGHGR